MVGVVMGYGWMGPRFHPRASMEMLGEGELMALWQWDKVLNLRCCDPAGQNLEPMRLVQPDRESADIN